MHTVQHAVPASTFLQLWLSNREISTAVWRKWLGRDFTLTSFYKNFQCLVSRLTQPPCITMPADGIKERQNDK